MIRHSYASQYTRIASGQTAVTIGNSGTIRVHGIVIQASLNGTVTLLEEDGTTVIATLTVLANTSFELRTGFIAHRGLRVTTDANSVCTVFHTSGKP